MTVLTRNRKSSAAVAVRVLRPSGTHSPRFRKLPSPAPRPTATPAPTQDAGKSLRDWAAPRLKRFEQVLQAALPEREGLSAPLHEAMRYATLDGGKRLRPLLCMAATEICGSKAETVLPTACAIEMIHSFSLVHDDLPCMDNDMLRRGRPTCHVRFGEALAVLGGDALLVQAFAQVAQQAAFSPAPRVIETLILLTKASGADGMAGGQVADMEAEGSVCDADRLAYIHTHKTGVMICAALSAGVILAGGDARTRVALESYGDALGHVFQIVDDILNVTGDAARLGKAVGSDTARGKATYPALLGLDGARQAASDTAQRALDALLVFGSEADPLRWIVTWALERDH